MTTTTYYNLNIVEGTDIVNPLTVDNPNYEKIDEVLHDNAVSGVTLATEVTNGTVHAITRENSDCSVIRFIATSQWKAGDSVTVDGVPVLALLPSGETLPNGAYVINANVLCVLTGTNLTVYVGKKEVNANEIAYNDTNVEGELNALNASLSTVNSDLTTLNTTVSELSGNINKNFSSIGDFIDLAIGTYTFESDGYISWNVYATGHGFTAAINSNIPLAQFYNGQQEAGGLFVLKGMTVNVIAKTGGDLRFFPIIYAQ